MQSLTVKPSKGYAAKLRVVCIIVALLVAVVGYFFGLLVGIEDGPRVASTIFVVFLIVDAAWWIPAMILSGVYYRSLSYEIQDDEVIVRVGILTKSVKHVPYRTVTNVTINRGILDRYMFNLGTLKIQTAGMSGSTGAEESLVGLANVQEIYDIVVQKLRLFRGGMAPTAAEVDVAADVPSGDVLNAILNELKAIRKNTEK
jgi:membrane protein YdbS with pleckstrin-like domain